MKLDKTRDLIANWLKEYAKNNGQKKLIVGVSGGIDSALTSTLCALSGITTIAVSMPIHQKKQEINLANKHIEWLTKMYTNTQMISINLTNLFDTYKTEIPLKYQSDLGLANSKARLRMMTLYQIATKENGIVVGTGNKIEDFGIGFFTKYGDGGVDISPIADLTKSEVQKLASFCGVHLDILNAQPTDGLWEDGRTDENQIGATYKELEWAMCFNKNREITEREKEVIKIYQKLHRQNNHKMIPIPICNIPENFRN